MVNFLSQFGCGQRNVSPSVDVFEVNVVSIKSTFGDWKGEWRCCFKRCSSLWSGVEVFMLS